MNLVIFLMNQANLLRNIVNLLISLVVLWLILQLPDLVPEIRLHLLKLLLASLNFILFLISFNFLAIIYINSHIKRLILNLFTFNCGTLRCHLFLLHLLFLILLYNLRFLRWDSNWLIFFRLLHFFRILKLMVSHIKSISSLSCKTIVFITVHF